MGWTPARYAADTGRSPEITDTSTILQESPRTRAALVMTDELLRHGLAHVMSHAGDIDFLGNLCHGPELADRLRALRPDLLILGAEHNLSLSGLLVQLDHVPKVIVVMEGGDAPAGALELIQAGADALVDRRSSSAELLSTITRVVAGHSALDSHCANTLISELRAAENAPTPDFSHLLTRREREVLDLLTDGLDNRAIATELFISEATVKFHLHNIMDKSGVHKRAALIAAALRAHPRTR